MKTMNESVTTVITVSPGSVLKTELKARGMKQKELAEIIGIQTSHLSELIKGERAINDSIAGKLEEALQIPAIHWIRLQCNYDKSKKELEKLSEEDRAAEVEYNAYNQLCDIKLIMRTLGQDSYSIRDQIDFCHSVLSFSSPEKMQMNFGRFHRSEKTGQDARMINTWAILAKQSVNGQTVDGNFGKSDINLLCTDLSDIFNVNKETEVKTKRILSRYGIRFSVVKKLDRASIDGFSFYCDDGVPAIVVTKRFNRIDNYAFAVMHEVGHLALQEPCDFPILSISEDDENLAEDQANNFAAEKLIPNKIWETAPKVPLNPFIIQKQYAKWAAKNSLNKWIVLGRISHETGMYKFKSDPDRTIN